MKDYLNNNLLYIVIDYNGVTNMNDIEEIRKRMNKRKKIGNHKILNDHHFLKFYNMMIKCMVLLLVMIAVFTYIKITPQGEYIQEHVFSRIHFQDAMNWINKQFYNFFPDEEHTTVSKTVSYQHIKDNLYTNQSNEVVNFSKGRVIYTGKQDLLGNYVTVLLDNNVEVTYGKLSDIFVSSFDQVDQATIIGTCEDNVLIVFTQGEKEIDYETFQKILKDN